MNFNAMLGSQMCVCFSQRSGSDRQGNWELRTLRQGGFRQGIPFLDFSLKDWLFDSPDSGSVCVCESVKLLFFFSEQIFDSILFVSGSLQDMMQFNVTYFSVL